MKRLIGSLAAGAAMWTVAGSAVAITPIPEPGSISLVGIALAAVVYFATRGKKK
jgi:hypothetical protein